MYTVNSILLDNYSISPLFAVIYNTTKILLYAWHNYI